MINQWSSCVVAAYHFRRQSHSFEKDGTACAQKEEKMSSRRIQYALLFFAIMFYVPHHK